MLHFSQIEIKVGFWNLLLRRIDQILVTNNVCLYYCVVTRLIKFVLDAGRKIVKIHIHKYEIHKLLDPVSKIDTIKNQKCFHKYLENFKLWEVIWMIIYFNPDCPRQHKMALDSLRFLYPTCSRFRGFSCHLEAHEKQKLSKDWSQLKRIRFRPDLLQGNVFCPIRRA